VGGKGIRFFLDVDGAVWARVKAGGSGSGGTVIMFCGG